MRLLMIRHGHSRHALRGLIADVAACEGLSDQGRAQAEALARRLAGSGDWKLIASPVPRALETARILGDALGIGAPALEPDLREQLPGEAEGLDWPAFQARYGPFDPRAEPNRPFSPGGETWRQFEARVAALLARLAQTEGDVMAVTHAGFIVAATLQLMGSGEDHAWLQPSNTGVSEWRHDGERWRLERYNDTAHLDAARLGPA
jgi:broad specificity phosphatase PhoE